MDALVIHQEEGLWILNKPSGMSVHNEEPSLQKALVTHGGQGLHFINRIDRETSGLVVATREASQVADLTNAIHSRGRKIYRGIVKRPREFALDGEVNHWVWTDPLSDKAEGRKNPLGLAKDRVLSETRVRVMSENTWFLDLQFELVTGRQHQIRKHCAFHQMPLLNDSRYGRDALNTKIAEVYGIRRMLLHAFEIDFEYRGRNYRFEAPLPGEFHKIFQTAM